MAQEKRASVCVVAVDTRRRRSPRRPHVLHPPTGSRTRPVLCLSGHAPFIVPRDTSALSFRAARAPSLLLLIILLCEFVFLLFCCCVRTQTSRTKDISPEIAWRIEGKMMSRWMLLFLLLCLSSRRSVNCQRRRYAFQHVAVFPAVGTK